MLHSTTDADSKIYIEGNVSLYIDGDFFMNDNSQLILNDSATLKIYITGMVVTDSNARANTLGNPKNFQIYSSAQSSDYNQYKISIASTDGFYGIVYAPKAAMQIDLNGTVYGSMRGKFVHIASGGTIFYDESLLNLKVTGTPEGYATVTWHEIY